MLKTSILISLTSVLIACSGNTQKMTENGNETAEIVKYKSNETNELILNFQNSTYSYKEKYSPQKVGEDLGYEYDSRGKFSIKNDTLFFFQICRPRLMSKWTGILAPSFSHCILHTNRGN